MAKVGMAKVEMAKVEMAEKTPKRGKKVAGFWATTLRNPFFWVRGATLRAARGGSRVRGQGTEREGQSSNGASLKGGWV